MAGTSGSARVLGVLGALLLIAFFAECSSNSQDVAISLTPQTAYVGAGQTTTTPLFTATVTGTADTSVTWAVNGIAGGNSTVGTIDANGDYSAPSVTQNTTVTITATSKRNTTKSASATASVMAPGVVTATNNPQVAQYTITPPAAATVSIEFGTDTSYDNGHSTWTQTAPAGGGPVSIYVAGMLANTLYHMRAVVQFTGSNTVDDTDQTFTTSGWPAANLPVITASTSAGQTPQSGVELLSLVSGSSDTMTPAVTDLAGNIIWAYNGGVGAGTVLNPIKLMPNGDFLMNFDENGPDGGGSLMQEIDLADNVKWQMTGTDLNNALAAANAAGTCHGDGCNVTVIGTHHDFAMLPNGHLIVLASLSQVVSGTTVTGDVVIDLDQNHNPVWTWNEFDHLDTTRQGISWPDWTHTNAVVYSPSDNDLIVSIRDQSWIIKIDYNNGNGTGNILWTLGYQGDFTLVNGTDPVDWPYASHDVNVISSNSSGTFQVTMFDNGDNRVLNSNGEECSTTPACTSQVPIFQLDESAKTATIEWLDDLAPTYSFWGGSSRVLANGDIEFDECALSPSQIFEVTKTTPPVTVWQMQVAGGQNAYRATRIPSLYPGVQW